MRAVNLLLYLAGCALLGTGLLLEYRLPPGSQGGRGLSVLGMTRHDWGDIHFWIAVFCAALVLVHLIQNRAWLAKIAAKGRRGPLAGGLLAGAAVVVLFLCLPVSQRQQHRPNARHPHAETSPPKKPRPTRQDKPTGREQATAYFVQPACILGAERPYYRVP